MAFRPVTDGVIRLRPSRPADSAALIAGRDEVFHRFLGDGHPEPDPFACICVGGRVFGWVDHDSPREWLAAGEVNIGYGLAPEHRGKGFATRAVQLLRHLLALEGVHRTVTALIDPENDDSLAVIAGLGFTERPTVDGERLFAASVPPLAYTDGRVTIRRRHIDDTAMDLAAKDEEQIRWLWRPGERESWEAMDDDARLAHARRWVEACHDSFGLGPKWTFSVDIVDRRAAGYVDVDLANDKVPAGEANVSYATHPDFRNHGVATASVRLVLRFLADHTAARCAHLLVDPANHASVRVATAVGATAVGTVVDGPTTLVRHTIELERR